jgi:hypothetical protein
MTDITYEVSHDEPITPDPEIRSRFREVEIDNRCGHGCKIYELPGTRVRVLAHNSAYGCKQ